jgi:hypothetical protein
MKSKKTTVWMAVSKDEYRLPIAIADTARELAEIFGTNENNVKTIASKGKHGNIKNPRYIAVEIDKEENIGY